MENLLSEKIYKILDILRSPCPEIISSNNILSIRTNHKEIISVENNKIKLVIPELFNKVISNPGELKDEDEFLELEQIALLTKDLDENGSIKRLNHIGFCYPVKSAKSEKKLIAKEVQKSGLKFYEMKSNDQASWWFVGDLSDWRDPLLEILPVEGKINDLEIGYWLPHIHINIDTTFTFDEIKNIVDSVFKGFRKAIPIEYDGFINQARIWMGVIGGVNIHLDLNTNVVNTRYVRKVMLKEIIFP